MKRLLLLLLTLGMLPTAAFARAEFKIVTASERGTYIQIGRDLAKFVAEPADINLEVLPSKGSADNVARPPSIFTRLISRSPVARLSI